jgi:CheY-like chemotaxis protein
MVKTNNQGLIENMSKRFKSALIIDDSEMDLLVNKMLLTSSEIAEEIQTHTSGTDALAYLKEVIGGKKPLPEIIFLDINMPVMDGFAFLDAFEKLPENARQSCKIAVISSSEDLQDIEKVARYKTVVGYFVKPLNGKELKKL